MRLMLCNEQLKTFASDTIFAAKKGGDKKTVKLESNHFPMSFTNPISYLEQAAMFK